MTTRLHARQPIFPKILLLDSLGRAGKFLLSKVISHFERVEYFQYHATVEHIPILWKLGCLETESAVAYLQLNVELHAYDMVVGRYLNTRVDDSSSIYNSLDYKRYLQRAVSQDGLKAVDEFQSQGRIPSFVTHEILPHVSLYFQAFPQFRMINMQRHPVDVIHSWHKRSWGARFGLDPLSFIPVMSGSQGPVPWFAKDWEKEYQAMSPVDRVVKSVMTLSRLEQESYRALEKHQKERIFFLSYEYLITRPQPVIRDVANFLETKPMAGMETVLQREQCYRDLPLSERKGKYEEIAKDASPALVKEMVSMCREYEKQWQLEPLPK